MTWWTRRKRTYRTRPIKRGLVDDLNRTQGAVPGFDLGKFQRAHVVMIGAGGIGSHVASALVRKGIGRLTLLDDDVVELKNCTRQLFDRDDVGEWKAVALGRRLARDGMFKTRIEALPRRFQEWIDLGYAPDEGAILIGGVDNNPSRLGLCAYAVSNNHAAIHAAVSGNGNQLYVMVQEPGKACWACAFPHYVDDRSYPCNLPGIIDVLQVTAGLIVYAVDSLVCGRHREWTVRDVVLDGGMPDRGRMIERKATCRICGGKRGETHAQESLVCEEAGSR